MKHIAKQVEPSAFADWKARVNQDWQPTYDDLRGAPKIAVKAALMEEQGYICCYCERRLTDEDSHIEHFKPQSDHSVDPLDYSNLLCSCQDQIKKGEPRHCGNLKDHWFDPVLLISPLDGDCENRFSFTGDGRIVPATVSDPAAVETIKRLGLDIPKLNALRAQAIEPFLDESLTVEELRGFVSGYLVKDASGRFGEFWTTIRHVFGGYVAA
ncbi:MAG: TIGR02646 family protein [Opitutales bacterium]|nr:TIGR02646 family protein [Opitutales bacterium]